MLYIVTFVFVVFAAFGLSGCVDEPHEAEPQVCPQVMQQAYDASMKEEGFAFDGLALAE